MQEVTPIESEEKKEKSNTQRLSPVNPIVVGQLSKIQIWTYFNFQVWASLAAQGKGKGEGSMQSKGEGEVSMQSKGESEVSVQSKGEGEISMQSKGEISMQSKGEVSMQSKGEVSMQSKGKGEVSAQSKVGEVSARSCREETIEAWLQQRL